MTKQEEQALCELRSRIGRVEDSLREAAVELNELTNTHPLWDVLLGDKVSTGQEWRRRRCLQATDFVRVARHKLEELQEGLTEIEKRLQKADRSDYTLEQGDK